MHEVDKVLPPKRVRKDRVVALALEVPCPRELTEAGKSDLFFEKAYETLQGFLGAENIHGGVVHKDEVHDYYDKRTKQYKTSMEHAHVLATPFVPDVGVNGKQCVTRGFFNLLNREMEEMCKREFGIEYMTHEAPQKKTVEALKLQGHIDELEHKIETLEKQNRKLFDTKIQYESEIENLSKECSELKKINKDLEVSASSIVTDKAMFMERYLEVLTLNDGVNALEDCNIRYYEWKNGTNAGASTIDGIPTTDDFDIDWNED